MPILFYKATDEYGYLSNFAKYPIKVDNLTFGCNEQYIMYTKAKLFNDHPTAEKILATSNPMIIKQLGRQVKNFDQKIWNDNVNLVADICNTYKFTQHPQLKHLLLETKDEIIAEASPSDAIWGIGVNSITGRDPKTWRGLNILGNSLMRTRKYIIDNTK